MNGTLTRDDLWSAIGDLTNGNRQANKDGETHFVQSLWEQLQDSTVRAGGALAGAKSRSRPPISTAVVSVVQEVVKACEMEIRSRKAERPTVPVLGRAPGCTCRPPRQQCTPGDPTAPPVIGHRLDVPAALRRINSLIQHEPEDVDYWARMVRRWVTQASEALGLNHGLTTLRGVPCMVCHVTWVWEKLDGETVKQPALHLEWNNDLPHYVWCANCGESTWPADFALTAELALHASRTQETAADMPGMVDGLTD